MPTVISSHDRTRIEWFWYIRCTLRLFKKPFQRSVFADSDQPASMGWVGQGKISTSFSPPKTFDSFFWRIKLLSLFFHFPTARILETWAKKNCTSETSCSRFTEQLDISFSLSCPWIALFKSTCWRFWWLTFRYCILVVGCTCTLYNSRGRGQWWQGRAPPGRGRAYAGMQGGGHAQRFLDSSLNQTRPCQHFFAQQGVLSL